MPTFYGSVDASKMDITKKMPFTLSMIRWKA